MSKYRQAGFSIVEIVIAGVVLVAATVIGYVVFNQMNDKKGVTSTTETQQMTEDSSTYAVPAVQSTSDLDAASKALDETDIDANASDAAALDAETGAF
ncbi:MAG TPA: hypothetical protein VJ836_06460 [Candidatus Saccharimonadales bacterium]|nr:hypothetical protein [Candidatus Saccharimonadales bacterium]